MVLTRGFSCRFGLSYTTFSLSDLDVKVVDGPAATVSVKVKNDGQITGSQVVQVYVSYPDLGIAQPEYQLRGFAKVKDLKPGETKATEIKLDKYAVAYWDEREDAWVVAPGNYGGPCWVQLRRIVIADGSGGEGEVEMAGSVDIYLESK